MSDGGRATVFLVHGTWGRKSSWTQSTSALTVELTARGCEVRRFEWSGSNRHAARIEAAAKLKADVEEAEREGARVVVIAHSHGGNVGRMALATAADESPQRTLVAVGTPFFVTSRGRSVLTTYAFFGATSILPPAATAAVLWRHLGAPWWCLVPSYVVGLGCLVAMAAQAVVWSLGHSLRGRSPEALARLVAPPPGSTDVHVVLVAGDEASLGLAVGHFIGAVADWSSRPAWLLPNWPYLVLYEVGALWLGSTLGWSSLTLSLALFAPIFMIAVLLLPALYLDWLDRLVGGWDGAGLAGRDGLSEEGPWRLLVAPVPVGPHLVHHVEPSSAGLAHTSLMTRADVRQLLVRLAGC